MALIPVITGSEFLNDRVRVHYTCKKPWAADDETGVVEVPYESMRVLPEPPSPEQQGGGVWREVWEESVHVPAGNVSILFRFGRWQETDDCRMESLIGGPYLGTPDRLNSPACASQF